MATREEQLANVYNPGLLDGEDRDQAGRDMTAMIMSGTAPDPNTPEGEAFYAKWEQNKARKDPAWAKFQDRQRQIQADIAGREKYDPLSGEFGDEYRAAMGWGIGRGQEMGRAGAMDDAAAGMMMRGADMSRSVAQGGPQVSPNILRGQQNILAQQTAAKRAMAGGGALAARNAMMASIPSGVGLANQGVGMMSRENMQNLMNAQGALGAARQGNIARAGLNTNIERQNDMYRNARATGAMGYLGLGERAKQAQQQAMIKMLGASTGQEQQPTKEAAWRAPVAGALNLATTIAGKAAQKWGGDHGLTDPNQIIDPNQLKQPGFMKG